MLSGTLLLLLTYLVWEQFRFFAARCATRTAQ